MLTCILNVNFLGILLLELLTDAGGHGDYYATHAAHLSAWGGHIPVSRDRPLTSRDPPTPASNGRPGPTNGRGPAVT